MVSFLRFTLTFGGRQFVICLAILASTIIIVSVTKVTLFVVDRFFHHISNKRYSEGKIVELPDDSNEDESIPKGSPTVPLRGQHKVDKTPTFVVSDLKHRKQIEGHKEGSPSSHKQTARPVSIVQSYKIEKRSEEEIGSLNQSVSSSSLPAAQESPKVVSNPQNSPEPDQQNKPPRSQKITQTITSEVDTELEDTGKMSIECSACGKACANNAILENHHRQGAHANDFYCFPCDTFFANEVELSSHNIELHNEASIACDNCACVFLKEYTYKKHYEGCSPAAQQHTCFEYGCGFRGNKVEVNRHWEQTHQADAIAAEAYYKMRKAEKAAQEAASKVDSGFITVAEIMESRRDPQMTAVPPPKFMGVEPSEPGKLLPKPVEKDAAMEQNNSRPPVSKTQPQSKKEPENVPTAASGPKVKPEPPTPAALSKPFAMPPRPPTPPPKFGPGSKPRPMPANVEIKASADASSRPRTVRYNHAAAPQASPARKVAPAPARSQAPLAPPTGAQRPKGKSARKPFCCLCTKEYDDWTVFEDHWAEKHPEVNRNPGVPDDHVPLTPAGPPRQRVRPGPPGRPQQRGPPLAPGRHPNSTQYPGKYPQTTPSVGVRTGTRGATDKKEVALVDQVKELLRQKALKESQEAAKAKLQARMQSANGKLPARQQKAEEPSVSVGPTVKPTASKPAKSEGFVASEATLAVPQDELRKALNIPKTMKAQVVLRELPGYGTKSVKKETMEDIKKKVEAGEPLPLHLAIRMAAERQKAKTENELAYQIPTLREQFRYCQGRPRPINWDQDEDIYVTKEVAEANGLEVPAMDHTYNSSKPAGSFGQGLGSWGTFDGQAEVARAQASEAVNSSLAIPAFSDSGSSQSANPFSGYGSDFLTQLGVQDGSADTSVAPSGAPSVAESVHSASTISVSTVLSPVAGMSTFLALPDDPRPNPAEIAVKVPGLVKSKSTTGMLFGRRR